jgi:Fe-S oxidoreductase
MPGSGTAFAIIHILLSGALICVFFYFVYMRVYKLVSQGKPEIRWDNIVDRITSVVVNVIGQKKLLFRCAPGVIHIFIFYGFLILSLSILNFLLDGLWHAHIPFTVGYAWYHFLTDTFILLVIVAMVWAFYRRLVIKPKEMELSSQALVILSLVTLMMVTDLMIFGAEIRMGELVPGGYLSHIMAGIWGALGVGEGESSSARIAYAVSWWMHYFIFFGFLIFLPISKHQHIMTAPLNVFFTRLGKPGTVKEIAGIEEQESWGVNSVAEFTWKQLLDSVTCQECGRCDLTCPANITGKPLSPKKLHLDIKHTMIKEGFKAPDVKERLHLIGDGADQQTFDEIWSCTTCGACEYQCPVMNEHIQKIIDFRRFLTLMEGNVPEEGQLALQNIENNSNPWGIGFNSRADWTQGLDVPVYGNGVGQDTEFCFYVGCAGSFDERNKKIAQSMAKILKAANVKFAILGAEEQCCGDSARRMGNEYLYQTLAKQNMQTMAGYGVKKIVTCCPHGFNTIKNEYPQFIADIQKESPDFKWDVQVYHAVELIDQLIRENKLKINGKLNLSAAYHDSCYLGRHNEIYDTPREVLKSIGVKVTELDRHHGRSFCCGAGGGRMWLEENLGNERVNANRTKEAVASGKANCAVNCPFCLTMFEDGLKDMGKESAMAVNDIVELVAKAIEKP